MDMNQEKWYNLAGIVESRTRPNGESAAYSANTAILNIDSNDYVFPW